MYIVYSSFSASHTVASHSFVTIGLSFGRILHIRSAPS